MIEGDGLLLIDSGGQYLGGTTDITRVWPIGSVSAAMKRDYTLVLKGTMALSRARFPRGTLSPMLDALARAPLWAEGLDFGHGTGHGVGYFLNVHEGPQSISKAIPDAHMAMQPGMITSIEPGLYRPGQWGVRIENLVLNVPADTAEGDTFGEFLDFETLTLCPIDTRCIERSLLRADEVDWLNAYHATVRERLAPRVSGDALAWLDNAHPAALSRCEAYGAGAGHRPRRHARSRPLLLDAGGHVRWRERVPTPAGDYAATLQAVSALVQPRRAAVGVPLSVGLGHPGALTAAGLIKNANSTCLNGRPLQARPGGRCWAGRCALANDANCLALSEATDGAGAGAAVVFAVILGTGRRRRHRRARPRARRRQRPGRRMGPQPAALGRRRPSTRAGLLLRPARLHRDLAQRPGPGARPSAHGGARSTAPAIAAAAAAGDAACAGHAGSAMPTGWRVRWRRS